MTTTVTKSTGKNRVFLCSTLITLPSGILHNSVGRENSAIMGKGANKKRNRNAKRPKGSYQSTDDGDDKPSSRQRNRNARHDRHNNKPKYNDDDNTKLQKTLDADGLEIIEMNSDGNCLFRALSDQLFGDHGNNHWDVRSDVCDFIKSHEGDFKVFLVFEDEDDEDQEEEDARDFEHYIQNMRQDGEWGGNLEIVAAARLYQ